MSGANLPTRPSDPGEDAALSAIAEVARCAAGLSIGPAKHGMLKARLSRRLRRLGLPDFPAYLAYLSAPAGSGEHRHLVMALTTNVSHFFREPHHFEVLRRTVLPPLLRAAGAGQRVRLWSAGCAHGQEAYSLAMTILDLMPQAAARDVRILATDIDAGVVAKARRGRFPLTCRGEIPAPARSRFTRDAGSARKVGSAEKAGRTFDIADDAKELIRFRQHNLHAAWPMQQRFDVIFCRNVLIYFNAAAQARLVERFAAALTPGGWLFLGHSEHITDAARRGLVPAGATAFRRAPSLHADRQ